MGTSSIRRGEEIRERRGEERRGDERRERRGEERRERKGEERGGERGEERCMIDVGDDLKKKEGKVSVSALHGQ